MEIYSQIFDAAPVICHQNATPHSTPEQGAGQNLNNCSLDAQQQLVILHKFLTSNRFGLTFAFVLVDLFIQKFTKTL